MGMPVSYAGSTQGLSNTESISTSKGVTTTIGLPTAQEMIVYETWAKNASDSQMYRNVGKESAIMMIILSGREFGIGPAQALNGGLQIIEGKVELSARMMSGLIRRAGHELKITDGEDCCTVWGKRKDTGEQHEVTYTIEMAQRAGLVKEKGGWKRNQEDMLYNRALSRVARRLFSDVIGIGYIQGEISDSRGISDRSSVSQQSNTPNVYEKALNLVGANDRPIMVRFIYDVSKLMGFETEWVANEMMNNTEDALSRFETYKAKFNQKIISLDQPNTENE